MRPAALRADGSGIWEGLRSPGSRRRRPTSTACVRTAHVDKADPFASPAELPPATASRVWSLDYEWGDAEWMRARGARNALDAPMSIYEVHLGLDARRGRMAALL
jgi:1,4-alpha-glucan branching enzyme